MLRRRVLLLALSLVALVVVPQAPADTSTTPAPDPNPPPGASPDPYTPAAKSPPPKPTPAPVHTVPHVYTRPAYTPPAYTPPERTVPVQHTAPRTAAPVAPVHPAVVPHHVTRAVHKAKHRLHRRRVVVHHKKKPVIVRVTPKATSYVATVVNTMSAAVVTPRADGIGHRRRTAGLALVALCAASLSLIFLGRRGLRERLS